jgi:hypothetical protein
VVVEFVACCCCLLVVESTEDREGDYNEETTFSLIVFSSAFSEQDAKDKQGSGALTFKYGICCLGCSFTLGKSLLLVRRRTLMN